MDGYDASGSHLTRWKTTRCCRGVSVGKTFSFHPITHLLNLFVKVRSASDAAELGVRAAVRIAAGGGKEIMAKLRDDIARASKEDAEKVL